MRTNSSKVVALAVLLILCQPIMVSAQFTFITNNGAITITGYTGSGGEVIIPDTIGGLPVTKIGDLAFVWNTNLTNITIPDTVTEIGHSAFGVCTNLTDITIGSGVTNIGDYAFYDCLSLLGVAIPESVTSIGKAAFGGDLALTSVTIPAGVVSIGPGAFGSCYALDAITADANNPVYSSLDGVLFSKDRSVLVEYPGGRSGGYTTPESVTSIGESSFQACYRLTDIAIPPTVTNIGSDAFYACVGLTNITIPRSVTAIGDSAFLSCFRMTSITVDENNTAYSSKAGVLFNKNQTKLIQYPGGNAESYSLPESVITIGIWAFWGCQLQSVVIPEGVKEIGANAFANCFELTDVVIPNSITNIEDFAFAGCVNLKDATLGWGVARIGFMAFDFCTSLTGVHFRGDAPVTYIALFGSGVDTTVYYLPGTLGWSATFAERPTAPWFLPNPSILEHGPSFGVKTNHFGFVISWATNVPVVVEACANLAGADWSPIATNTLMDGWSYFSDPRWTNYPSRFYRLRSP